MGAGKNSPCLPNCFGSRYGVSVNDFLPFFILFVVTIQPVEHSTHPIQCPGEDLFAFYVTWVPYLALQFNWAAGRGYSTYYFILFACTLTPLQGFWNAVVYFRRKAKKRITEFLTKIRSSLSGAPSGPGGPSS